MGFAANAVSELIAPPPSRADRAPLPDKTNGPSFDDHLDAHADAPEKPDAPPVERPQHQDIKSAAKDDDTDQVDAVQAVAPPAQPAEPPAPPLSAQILAQLAGANDQAAQDGDAEPQPGLVDVPKSADAAPPLPAFTPPAPAPQQQAKPESEPQNTTPVAPIATDKPVKAQAPGKPAPQHQDAAPEPTEEAPPPQAQSEAAPAPTQSATDAALLAATPAPVVTAQAQPTRSSAKDIAIDTETPRASPKAELKELKADAKSAEPTSRSDAKPAAATAQALANFKDNLAALTGDANDTAPSVQAPATSTPAAALAQNAASVTQTVATEQGASRSGASTQVGHEIVRRFNGESTTFNMRLDPAELGRVDVRLEVTRDHRVNAIILADSPQALAELTRHARELEQTLQSAGLELNDNGLSFDLNQQRENFAEAGNARDPFAAADKATNDTPETPAPIARPRLESWRGVRLDVTA